MAGLVEKDLLHIHQTREAINNHLTAFVRKDSPDVIWLSVGKAGTRVGIRQNEAQILATWLQAVLQNEPA